MTREESKMMQGLAILIMIFYHLFNPSSVTEFQGTIIGNLALANNPVPFYVFLSGYGLYCVNRKGVDRNKYKRCARLYLHYWIITASFIFISYVLNLRDYDFSINHIIENAIGLKTDYYDSAWFVLPYCILALSSPVICRLLETKNVFFCLISSYLLYVVAAYLNRFDFFSANIWQTFYIQFSFVLGASFTKCNVVQIVKNLYPPPMLVIMSLLLLVTIRYYICSGVVVSFYAAGFITLAVGAKKPVWLKKCMLELGRESLNMWMIHTWIFLYLFKDEIYEIGNPAYMFLIVTLSSYCLSKMFNIVLNPISRLIVK